MRSYAVPAPLLLAVALASAPASADPLRLRGDAFATAESPAGLLVLQGADRLEPWIDAEAVVWMGAGDDTAADTLIVDVDVKDLPHRRDLRVGRQIVVAGALRPLHLDGGNGHVRLPGAIDVSVFGGLPVIPRLGPRLSAWAAGARMSRAIGKGSVGVAWLEERDHGDLDTREVGVDTGWAIGDHVDLAAASSLDLASFGLAEARATASWSAKAWRVEAFGVDRSPAHLLPATSLFTVLGDNDAGRAGTSVRWRAAPRLDVDGTVAARLADLDVREDLTAGCTLRLDDRGASSLGLELHRQGAQDDGGWTGARGTARVELSREWTTSAELELVVPDAQDAERGTVWPWGLGALTWKRSAWEIAGAVEASASPQYSWRVDGLVRASRAWGSP